ncbi:MAG: hypothetical protein ABIG32_00065 [Candidatus Uhrbacteria bacterium]|nr:hypothetical protein [Patescibacteria group bacterium]MBU1906770.1 hypothetical protein [Patescibacteria group bacterium]
MPKIKTKTDHKEHKKNYWLVSVNMGYGHMRAAYPLLEDAAEPYIIANDYKGIPKSDRNLWKNSRKIYETLSRSKQIPVIGEQIFDLIDRWQEIPSFYPRRDLSKANIQVKETYKMYRKGFMRHLIEKLDEANLPMVNTFFTSALAADYHGYRNDIYCIITDTDFSRSWVALDPKKSKVKYFAPTRRAVARLKLYGVPAKNIILTGFPLPKENVGGLKYEVIKPDLGARLANLDPQNAYMRTHEASVAKLLNGSRLKKKSTHPLTLMFAVGGAGAQREMVGQILRSLKSKLRRAELRLRLVAGSRKDVLDHFEKTIDRSGLSKQIGKSIEIIYDSDRNEYFRIFNEALHTTDILWTKPSELSFYVGLGIPVIMAEPIGSQEDFNYNWLRNAGAGIPERDPRYVDEWLDDMLNSGWLARAAVNGFTNAPKRGAYRIEEIVAHRKQVLPEPVEPI